jgi:cystathionine beta-lyase
VQVRFVDTTDDRAIDRELSRRPRLVLMETPTNPLLQVTDIASLALRVHEHHGLLAVDNSLCSPYLQQPLEHGADLVIHSATKYLSGHGDLTAGAVVAKDEGLAEPIAFYQNAAGCGLAPFDAWLLLRGIKTLALRLEKQQTGASHLAEFLAGHPAVRKVRYPGLANHPGRDTHFRQARGASGMVSFETGSVELSKKFIEETSLFGITVSFGAVSSSISLPAHMSHASIPGKVRNARLLPEDLVRISVGIEHPEDLIEDLSRALDTASKK